jgi:predicted aspartyl protease
VGVFRYPIEVGAAPEGPFVSLEALVGTGAFYTWVPASILRDLGVVPALRRQFKVADGRVIEREVAEVVVRIDGQASHTWCVFGDEGTDSLLGAFTLEAFALLPDTVSQRLVPMPTLPLLRVEPGVPSDVAASPLRRHRVRYPLASLTTVSKWMAGST